MKTFIQGIRSGVIAVSYLFIALAASSYAILLELITRNKKIEYHRFY